MQPELSAPRMGFFDRLGIVLSSLCILHCLAMPFATTYLSVAGMEYFTEDLLHRALLLVLAASGLFAFVPGLRRHRDWSVALLALLGFGLVFFGALGVHGAIGHEYEIPINIAGSLGMISAHVLNYSRNKRCHTDAACDHDHALHSHAEAERA